MLYHPCDPDLIYKPTPSYFLRNFDVYDREETLGEELAQYDPMNYDDLDELMYKYLVLPLDELKNYTPAHKKSMLEALKTSLEDPYFNFDKLVERDDDECFYLAWEISDARKFFTNIYKIMSKYWGNLDVEE